MIKFWRDQNNLRMILISILLLITYSFILVPLGVFDLSRLKVSDFLTRLKYSIKSPPENIKDIVIIEIDDNSLKKMGKKWPWDREVFADLLKKLNSYQAQLICLDLVFVGSSSEVQDNLLAKAIQDSPQVLLASYFDEEGEHVLPYGLFLESGGESGFINKPQDEDFKVRDAWAILFSPKYEVKDYSFEIKTVARYLNIPIDKISFDDHHIIFKRRTSSGPFSRDVMVPVRKDGTMAINYTADSDDWTVLPFWKVIMGEVPAQAFQNKIVLVGATTEIIHDIYLTPFGSMPGVEICANNILMLISNNFLKEAPVAVSFMILLIFSLVMALSSYTLPFLKSIIFNILLMIAFLSGYFALLFFCNYSLDYFGIIFLGVCIFIFSNVFRYLKIFLANASLRKRVATDISTGLYISRYFRFKLQAELTESVKSKSNISLVIIRIDNFQQINNDYGVKQINLVLRTFAQIFRDNSPKGALLARYGEDKFSLLFKINHSEVFSLVGKIKEEIENFAFSGLSGSLKIVFSIGIASYPRVQVRSSQDLIRCAEAVLTRACGQNKVCIFDPQVDKVQLGMQEKKLGHGDEFDYMVSDYLEEMNRDLNTTLKELQQLHKDMEIAFFDFIRSLVRALEAKDIYTAGHSDRVSKYSLILAESIGMSEDELKLICRVALLHDIGKIGMPEYILHKEGTLTKEEFEIVKQHPLAGARILEPISFFKEYIPLVLHHHERYDGTGYPHGLSRDFIPDGAHIIAIADAFDSMTTGRTYTKPKTIDEAISELRQKSGGQFKPLYVEKFIQALKSQI